MEHKDSKKKMKIFTLNIKNVMQTQEFIISLPLLWQKQDMHTFGHSVSD